MSTMLTCYTSEWPPAWAAAPPTLTIFVITIIQNVIRDLQRRLVDQAITDPLTGTFNRRHMAERRGEVVGRKRRTSAASSLLIIDVDHFKRINDDLGHEAGDGVLKGIVSIVRTRARRLDAWIQRADAALHAARQSGRNRVAR